MNKNIVFIKNHKCSAFDVYSKFNPLSVNGELSRHDKFDLFMDLDTEVGT